jgi:hypothetical protein
MSEATPEGHKGRLKAMEKARQVLSEHFDRGNAFGLIQLSKDFADGTLEPADDLGLEEQED